MDPALGGLRRADDSCSLARTAVVEQLDVVEDIRAGVLPRRAQPDLASSRGCIRRRSGRH